MKVVIAIDSFKGSLSSVGLAGAAEKAIGRVYPDSEIVKVSVADGGEGTVEALVEGTAGRFRTVHVSGPLGDPVEAQYGIDGDGNLAIIEMAAASGLTLVSQEMRNPLLTSSFGTGELILDALKQGCRKFLVGIGGSATSDCGMGMMEALGLKFLDEQGNVLEGCGKNLIKTAAIDDSQLIPEALEAEFLIACDVDNPLYGPKGAAHVFGPQKGADDLVVEVLDKGLKRFNWIVEEKYRFDMNALPGAGAAGGLGGAFAAFLGGKLEPGIDIVMKMTDLAGKMEGADFVLTGEGRIDFQSVMGKTPTGVSRLAAEKDIPVVAIAGSVSDDAAVVHDYGIGSLFSVMNFPISLEEALDPERTRSFVEKNVEEIFRLIKLCETKYRH